MKTWLVATALASLIGVVVACGGGEPTGEAQVAEPEALAAAAADTATATPVPPPPTAIPSPKPAAEVEPVPTWTPVHSARAENAGPVTMDLGSGEQIPLAQLVMFDGSTLDLADLRGSVVVLNFWASWCPPCRWEMPAFEKIWQEYRDRGVVFVGVAVSDTEEAVRAFAEEAGVTYPLALNEEGDLMVTYGVLGLPTTILIDTEGNQARKIASPANEAMLRIFLNGLVSDG